MEVVAQMMEVYECFCLLPAVQHLCISDHDIAEIQQTMLSERDIAFAIAAVKEIERDIRISCDVWRSMATTKWPSAARRWSPRAAASATL